MNRKARTVVLGLLVLSFAIAGLPTALARASTDSDHGGRIVVANRGSGTISVISARTGNVVGTYGLPVGDSAPEPMYVVYSPALNRVFVGDRANDRVVVFGGHNFEVEATVGTGTGVFHMWADPDDQQLWVNNDVDATTTVIDPRTLEVLTTVPTPPDLVAEGGVPHDVVLDPKARRAYVSVAGLPGEHDYVVQYSTRTFEELGRAAVGKDPHLSLNRRDNLLYVPSQGSDTVYILDRSSMALVTELSVPGAHGAGMAQNGRYFYSTNLSGGGPDAIFTIDTRMRAVIGAATDAPYAVPHNIALAPDGKRLFVTHSGETADKVTFYSTLGSEPNPVYRGEVTVGLNPFGLAYVP